MRNMTSSPMGRRVFLKTTAAAATAAPFIVPANAHAAGSDVIKIGLIGCGGRGTGAAGNAMNAGPDVRLVAMADIFRERLDASRKALANAKPEQVQVPEDQCFVGFDAYQKVIECVDVVLITPTSHFNQMIFKAAVEAGKHCFVEKPHGLDVPNLKLSMAAAEEAKKKGLCVVSGLCWRYDLGVRETMKRVLDGAIGEVLAIQENYVSSPYGVNPRKEGQSEMEYQLWNWYHFNWLSGDQTAQQLVHSLDKASWALGDKPPKSAWGMGGRQTLTSPSYGDQFDHHAVVFEYDNGVRVYGFTRDQEDCFRDTSDLIIGTKGRCDVLRHRIEGATNWSYSGPKPDMYNVEHAELFAAVRAGRPINNSNYMHTSSALGILAQAACYSGHVVTWDQLMNSKRTFTLPKYGFDVEAPVQPGPHGVYPTAMQGGEELKKWLG